jgi:hypothetical protein
MHRQASTTFPSSKRSTVIPLIRTRLPEPDVPPSSPRVGHRGNPTGREPIGFRDLVLDRDLDVVEGTAVERDRLPVPLDPLGAVRVIRVVVDDVVGNEVAEAVEFSRHPDLEHGARGRLVSLRH